MAVGEAHVPVLLPEPKTSHVHHDNKPPPITDYHNTLSGTQTVMTSLVAGAIAGAIAKTTIAPLDRTKIYFQTSAAAYSWRAAVKWAREAVRSEGITALWRGNSATMARIVPYAAVQFTAHEQWKRLLGVNTPQAATERPWTHLAAGSLAGVTSQSVTYPLDLARARMAVTTAAQYATLRAVFRTIVRQEGYAALYRGYLATVLGVIPYAGVSFFTYDTLKHKYQEYFGETARGVTAMVLGGCAGVLGQSASYPLDIARRRMQTSRPSAAGQPYPYRSLCHTLRKVATDEGWRGFFKGLSMNWIKGPVAVGISFATYDSIKSTLRDMAVSMNS